MLISVTFNELFCKLSIMWVEHCVNMGSELVGVNNFILKNLPHAACFGSLFKWRKHFWLNILQEEGGKVIFRSSLTGSSLSVCFTTSLLQEDTLLLVSLSRHCQQVDTTWDALMTLSQQRWGIADTKTAIYFGDLKDADLILAEHCAPNLSMLTTTYCFAISWQKKHWDACQLFQ